MDASNSIAIAKNTNVVKKLFPLAQVSFNNFVSTLPASIGNWSDIESFIVEYNNLTGSLPEEIAMWSRLKNFAVRENQITGTLPIGIGQCTALEEVCAFNHSETAMQSG